MNKINKVNITTALLEILGIAKKLKNYNVKQQPQQLVDSVKKSADQVVKLLQITNHGDLPDDMKKALNLTSDKTIDFDTELIWALSYGNTIPLFGEDPDKWKQGCINRAKSLENCQEKIREALDNYKN